GAQTVPKNGEESLGYDKQNHVDRSPQGVELLSKYSQAIKEYGASGTCNFCYEYTCFDERLSNNELDTKLRELQEMPERWELFFIYWQSYRNETEQYYRVSRAFVKTLLELRSKRSNMTLEDYKEEWKRCEAVVGNNFIKQQDHVANVFYTFIDRENLSNDDFKNILEEIRASWKEVTIRTKKECISFIEDRSEREEGMRRAAQALRNVDWKGN
ncbi:hypothetical protein C922_05803, partial [Plasmodium inui San Antonio 1]